MKKMSVLLLMFIFTLSLTGCQLATTETTNSSTEITNGGGLNIGVPIEFNFETYDSSTESGYRDISEHIYFSWLGSDDLTYENLLISPRYGDSMVPIVSSWKTEYVENDEGVSITNHHLYFEADVYYSNFSSLSGIYSNVTYMREDGTTFEADDPTGYGVSSHLSITKKYETIFSSNEQYTIEYKFNFVEIDLLKTIEVRAYDIQENLLNTTMITETTLLEELTLHEDTDYIFVIETYEDLDGEIYTERLYYVDEMFLYFKYKFIDQEGFLIADNLKIIFPE